MKNDHARDAALQQTTGKLWPCLSPRLAVVTGGPMRNSEQSRYLAMLVGGLVMGLSVIFAALYTALNRPSAF
jgi:hypothetical protein